MKISEAWLREWVNPALNLTAISERLTSAGLEVEELIPIVQVTFSNVIIAEVISIEKHPKADRLQVCQVNIGKEEPLTIVCGAKNVRVGMKAPAALEGAVLPAKNLVITATHLRGVPSQGMLCSAAELGLPAEIDGLMVLPDDAPIGISVWDYLKLEDQILNVSITPNRGDCLSIRGVAYEIRALTAASIQFPPISQIPATISDVLPVTLKNVACPRYAGRIIRNVNANAVTPIWMQERLRRSGVRSIHAIVDVMNYVMLELGQPLHAFDLAHIENTIQVRLANSNEQLKLLDGQTVTLDTNTLVIADDSKPLALAGLMGGLDSAVTSATEDVFLESAFFAPTTIARAVRYYGFHSEAAYRFERGVDPELPLQALERASQLLLDIVGGDPGPIIEQSQAEYLPAARTIVLSQAKLTRILGFTLAQQKIETILRALDFSVKPIEGGWEVTVPARRFDVTTEIDLIEEIARINGYENLPTHYPAGSLQIVAPSENLVSLTTIRQALCHLGYQEVITYSFISQSLQALFDPDRQAKCLLNPLTADMEVMRTTLWPGLVNTFLYNQSRQCSRARLFETGLRFILEEGSLIQENVISGLIIGENWPEQWGVSERPADFFDLKGDLENLFCLTKSLADFEFKPGTHPALHPSQTAYIYRSGIQIGIMGTLNPKIVQTLDIHGRPIVFELKLESLQKARLPGFAELSKFPMTRRDLAILVNRTIPVELIRDTIRGIAGELLQSVEVFDLYQGKEISKDHKSVALALILQHASRNLVDEEVTDLMDRVVKMLKEKFAAELRG